MPGIGIDHERVAFVLRETDGKLNRRESSLFRVSFRPTNRNRQTLAWPMQLEHLLDDWREVRSVTPWLEMVFLETLGNVGGREVATLRGDA
jgi:hypothetical protein